MVVVLFLDYLLIEFNDRFNKDDSVVYVFGCVVLK